MSHSWCDLLLAIDHFLLQVTDRSFNVVDIKPKNMEELKEVITSAAFHPHKCNIFMYSSSRGSIKVREKTREILRTVFPDYT